MEMIVFRFFVYLFLSSLLKTFSINPFQGQYPNIAVKITTTPINPRIQRSIPEVEIAEIIKITPRTYRKIVSPLATFFVLVINSIFPP
jgi:hypothetical protein